MGNSKSSTGVNLLLLQSGGLAAPHVVKVTWMEVEKIQESEGGNIVTIALDDSTVLGALYGAAKRYPGGIEQLAADMDMPKSTLYGKLRGEKGYPLGIDEAMEILDFARGKHVSGWEKALHVMCYRLDHLAVPVPRAMRDGSAEGLREVSQMMKEVADIAQALSDATDAHSEDGKQVSQQEFQKIDRACAEAMEKIAETRERYRAQCRADKKKGRVR